MNMNSKPLHFTKAILILILLMILMPAYSQNVAINITGVAGNTSAMLDINSTNTGLLIPRVALTASNVAAPVGAPATSLLVYNIATAGIVPNNVIPGYYYWDGVKWVRFVTNVTTGVFWSIAGNAGTSNATNFVGTTDNVPLNFRVNNQKAGKVDHLNYNAFWGHLAGNSITSGAYNTALGEEALFNCTTGTANTATGEYALHNLTTGTSNTATGTDALSTSTTGNFNTANGSESMLLTTTGYDNAAFGARSLYSNTTGYALTAVGSYCLYNNTTGLFNTAIGGSALYYNTTGGYNTATGNEALNNNLGSYNTADGTWSLRFNTTGAYNCAVGYDAMAGSLIGNENTGMGCYTLLSSDSGDGNSGFGYRALFNNQAGNYNTSVGHTSLNYNTYGNNNTAVGTGTLFLNINGNNNTAIGYNAYATGTVFNNSTAIGNSSIITASNQVRLGNAAITSCGAQVGWTTLSDKRVKTNIKQNIPGLIFINQLQPVSYNYDLEKEKELLGIKEVSLTSTDVHPICYTGFIAQDVDSIAQKIGFDFSGVDKSGELWGLRYAEFVVPLVKAVQELSTMVEQQQQLIDKLNEKIESISEKH
jgi:hypothetical protein